ncbi:MAG: synthase chain precursor [Candidatus Midichloriaceae bacterium]|jgi:F0F1-type ATP synthase membrane subunit b/b'|nr:synthase chain precursor [Candidatus Midichloriaceae bacterium]
MFTESNVVAIASILFAIALYKPIKNFVLAFLDEKIQEAVKDIEYAKNLRIEAEQYLEESKKKLAEAEKTAVEIIEKANERSEFIIGDLENQFKEISDRKLSDSLARIAQQEQQIISELKSQTVELTMKYVEESLISELSKEAQMSLVNKSLKRISKIMN